MSRRLDLCAAVCFLLLAPVAKAGSPAPMMFFEQSTRRAPNAVESAQVAKVTGCTSFFVRNTVDKIFMVSARHCFGRAATNWCNTNGKIVRNDGVVGKCKRIVAADHNHDIFIYEADFPSPPEETLRLAAFETPAKVGLKMIGYPADKYNMGKLIVTEKCWITKARVASPHPRHSGDRSALHNCTTWGGNSGGPMILDGDDIAVGLPFTYSPGDYHARKAEDLKEAAHMAQMSDIVSVYRKELDAEGIVIVD